MDTNNGDGSVPRDPLSLFQARASAEAETIIDSMFAQLDAYKQDYREFQCRDCGKRQKQLTDVVDPKAIAKAGQIILQEYREQIESQQARRADLNVGPDHRNRAEWLALWVETNDDPSVNLLILASILAKKSGVDLSEVPELEGFINRMIDDAVVEEEASA